jgi:hypothetical protein
MASKKTTQRVEEARSVPIEPLPRSEQTAQPTLKELLLAESPRAEIPVPPRQGRRGRVSTAHK